MDDKPLDLSKRSASSNTEDHQHPTEKRQESIKHLGFTSIRSASGNENDFTEAEKKSNSLMKQDGEKSRLSFWTSRRHSIPKSSDDIPENIDQMCYVPAKNSLSKRHKSFGSATDTHKKHKSKGRAETNCYKKASEKCIPSTSAGARCNYGNQEIDEHIMKSREKSTFDCEYCGKTWKFKSAYKVHVRSHTGVKPYKCQHCGKRFTTKSNLNRHNVAHTVERPFSCNECLNTFKTRRNLKAHLRTHTGENPYTCDICGKTFQWQTQLTRHKEMHTKKAKETSF